MVHPQSIVHSLVAFSDGSMLAQLGEPDMRIPIAYTLGWPARLRDHAHPSSICAPAPASSSSRPITSASPPCGSPGVALRQGGAAPTLLNAANEVAVAAFLAGRIGFLDIARTVGAVLERLPARPCDDLDAVLAYDAEARRLAAELAAASRAGVPTS